MTNTTNQQNAIDEKMRADYAPYLFNGLVQPEPNQTKNCDNLRFTCEAILAGHPDKELLIAAVGSYTLTGLLLRPDGASTNQQGPDDYYGVCAINQIYARNIYNYGKSHWFVYRNENSDKPASSAWMWRQPALIAHMKNCAGLPLNWLDRKFIQLGLYLSAKSDDQDGKVMMWFVVRKIFGMYDDVDNSIQSWQKALAMKNPGGIGEVLGKYYDPAHFKHPNSIYLMGIFK